jgi:hypothetical protein
MQSVTAAGFHAPPLFAWHATTGNPRHAFVNWPVVFTLAQQRNWFRADLAGG